MPYAKGQSGNLKGRPVGSKCHVTKEIEKILQAGGGKKAHQLAEKLVSMALGGDMQAGKLVMERMYGRVATADELAKRDGATEATKMAPDQFRKKMLDLLRQPEFRDLVAAAAQPVSDSVQ